MFEEGGGLFNADTLPPKRQAAVEAALAADPTANKSSLVVQQRSEWAGWRGWRSAAAVDEGQSAGRGVAAVKGCRSWHPQPPPSSHCCHPPALPACRLYAQRGSNSQGGGRNQRYYSADHRIDAGGQRPRRAAHHAAAAACSSVAGAGGRAGAGGQAAAAASGSAAGEGRGLHGMRGHVSEMGERRGGWGGVGERVGGLVWWELHCSARHARCRARQHS